MPVAAAHRHRSARFSGFLAGQAVARRASAARSASAVGGAGEFGDGDSDAEGEKVLGADGVSVMFECARELNCCIDGRFQCRCSDAVALAAKAVERWHVEVSKGEVDKLVDEVARCEKHGFEGEVVRPGSRDHARILARLCVSAGWSDVGVPDFNAAALRDVPFVVVQDVGMAAAVFTGGPVSAARSTKAAVTAAFELRARYATAAEISMFAPTVECSCLVVRGKDNPRSDYLWGRTEQLTSVQFSGPSQGLV